MRPLRLLFLLALLAAAPVCTATADASQGAEAIEFAPNSVWTQKLSAHAPIARGSRPRVRMLARHVQGLTDRNHFPYLAIQSYSAPVYVARRGQRRVPVRLGAWGPKLSEAFGEGVPIPARAAAAVGTDGHLVIYQPSTDTMWEFWKAERTASGWQARWGGVMPKVSKNPGYFPGNWGSTATSLPVAAGMITPDDLRRGRIDHALAASVPYACEGWFVYPAQRTDGWDRRRNCLPEGARLRLDPKLDIDALKLPPVATMIARAAQDYGLIARDKTGGQTVSIFGEPTPPGQPDPYYGPRGLLRGERGWEVMRRFPWERLQMIEASRCTKAPCGRG